MYDDVRKDSSLKLLFDLCVSGNLRVSKTRVQARYSSYPCFRIEGREILVGDILVNYLAELSKNGFNFEKPQYFSEIMRKLYGWMWDVDRVLRSWINKVFRGPFFYNDNDKNNWSQSWILKPN